MHNHVKWNLIDSPAPVEVEVEVEVEVSRSACASEDSNCAYDIQTFTWLVRSNNRLYKLRTRSLSPGNDSRKCKRDIDEKNERIVENNKIRTYKKH